MARPEPNRPRLRTFLLLLSAAGQLGEVESLLRQTGCTFPETALRELKDWLVARCEELQPPAYGELGEEAPPKPQGAEAVSPAIRLLWSP